MYVSKSVLSTVVILTLAAVNTPPKSLADDDNWYRITEDEFGIKVETDKLEAVVPKKRNKQWMTGIEKQSFLDKATGFREVGDGLMVVDWLMEPGSDADWDGKLFAKD